MTPSPAIIAKQKSRYAQLEIAASQGLTFDSDIWPFLEDSETQLIELMQNNPPPPNAPGSLEFSWALYFLNNDAPALITKWLRDLGMPASNITKEDWDNWSVIWSQEGVLYGDGSLVSFATYAVLDPGWSLAVLDYLLLELGYIQLYPFGTKPQTLTVDSLPKLSIALFGDWGTGAYTDGDLSASPSQLISAQITAQYPDISIHLGDVYYAGTDDEEQTHLLDCWPKAPIGNFMLNSNHEMYNGANGYFGVSLASPIFSDQCPASYFQIEFGNWIIVGLDTAYYDTSFFFSDGAILDKGQISLLQQAASSGKRIMLLTHHNPIDITGEVKVGLLWQQVIDAMGGKTPDYWYWGHQHNGVMYATGGEGGSVFCRCLGNGGIPIGNASWLANNSNVDVYTHQPLANPATQQKLRVLNGFAILTFTEDDVTEQWYNQDGTPVK